MTISILKIKAVLRPKEFKRFQKFMEGQTIGIGADGVGMVFENDLLRFINGLSCID